MAQINANCSGNFQWETNISYSTHYSTQTHSNDKVTKRICHLFEIWLCSTEFNEYFTICPFFTILLISIWIILVCGWYKAMNVIIKIFYVDSFSLYVTWIELLGNSIPIYLVLLETGKLFSKVVVKFCMLSTSIWGFQLLHILAIFWSVTLF